MPEPTLARRISRLNWEDIGSSLERVGHARSGLPLLTEKECAALTSLYADDRRFRSRVDMARHRFGEGEYKYFSRPLPRIVDALRSALYRRLVPIANAWAEALHDATRYPATLEQFLAGCAKHGQTKPTPLLLRYESGGYNCLHQDLYGEAAFPLQAMIPLSSPGKDYTGGEFLLVEQRPRAQSAGQAIVPLKGELVIFPNRFRPASGKHGFHHVGVRHGASRILTGRRHALAIIFHDAS